MTLVALFYLSILRMGGYFGEKEMKSSEANFNSNVFICDDLSEDELLIGSLIERLLSVVKFNTHEVGQMETFVLTPGGCLVMKIEVETNKNSTSILSLYYK